MSRHSSLRRMVSTVTASVVLTQLKDKPLNIECLNAAGGHGGWQMSTRLSMNDHHSSGWFR
jgi:hypothetical protein